jgi:hypothetical protein
LSGLFCMKWLKLLPGKPLSFPCTKVLIYMEVRRRRIGSWFTTCGG